METIQIATTSNDKYAQHTAVMLTSLLLNKKSNNPINISILGTLSDHNKDKLNKSLERFNIKIEFLDIPSMMFKNFKVTHHFKKESYYRLLIPNLLPDVHKVIYLDGDIIVKDDITEIWNIDIENFFLAAVNQLHKKRHKALSIPLELGYFNAGVMVLNLNKWRENNTSKIVIDYLKNNDNKILYLEQDALNAVLYGKWLPLDIRWNYTTYLFERNLKMKSSSVNPAIIHFTGPKKPWDKGHPFQYEYFNYKKLTTWN